MSRKRILNITSNKKHDNVPTAVRAPGASTTTPGPITVGTGFASLFMPSARAMSDEDSGMAHRQKQTIFARGYKERVSFNVTGGGAWKWRRIVFSMKGAQLFNQPGDSIPFQDVSSTLIGNMQRVINTLPNAQYVRVRDYLFDGTEGSDWTDQYTAKVDTQRVTLHSDKTRVFNIGNESGKTNTFNMWTPLNKNIVYDEDESGASTPISYTSVNSKAGMGDLYVYDLVTLIIPSASGTSSVTFYPHGTFYWHER